MIDRIEAIKHLNAVRNNYRRHIVNIPRHRSWTATTAAMVKLDWERKVAACEAGIIALGGKVDEG